MLKHEIKNILIQFFVEEEIFDSSATSQILVTQTDLQLRELEIKRQIEIEKLKLERCYVPGVTRKEFRKPKFCYLESQQKALLKFNKIY